MYCYHSIKGREEDDVHKSKTSQNRMYSRTDHAANPTVSDRQEQVAVTQREKSSSPATGKRFIRIQREVKKEGCTIYFTMFTLYVMYVMYSVLFRVSSGGFDTFMCISLFEK